MKPVKATDAICGMDGTLKWARALLQECPQAVIDRVLESEPFVLGLSMDTARRVADAMLKRGIPESVANEVIDQIVFGCACSIQLMQLGYRQFWGDLIGQSDDGKDKPPKEGSHA